MRLPEIFRVMAANSPSDCRRHSRCSGSGERLGAGVPKAYVEVGGRTLLQHAIDLFKGHPRVGDVIVVVPPSDTGWYATVTPVLGGATRQASVAAGLQRSAETSASCSSTTWRARSSRRR